MISYSNKVAESGIELNNFPASLCVNQSLALTTIPLMISNMSPSKLIYSTISSAVEVDLINKTFTSHVLPSNLGVEGIDNDNYFSWTASNIYKNGISVYSGFTGTVPAYSQTAALPLKVFSPTNAIFITATDNGSTTTMYVHTWNGISWTNSTNLANIAQSSTIDFCRICYKDSDTAYIVIGNNSDDKISVCKYIFSTNTLTHIFTVSVSSIDILSGFVAFSDSSIYLITGDNASPLSLKLYNGSTFSVISTEDIEDDYRYSGIEKKDDTTLYLFAYSGLIYEYDITTNTKTLIDNYSASYYSTSYIYLATITSSFVALRSMSSRGNCFVLAKRSVVTTDAVRYYFASGNPINDAIQNQTQVNLKAR